ncbi:MAG TPA: CocE/NonD family hydrolase [Gemmataceae bacterium]|nr:CocE/NonD family hydrolase [Gemmataceae bacterium]
MNRSPLIALLGALLLLRAGSSVCAAPEVDLGVTEKHVMVPMRDGKKLSTYLYFPEGKGPWPVLYEQRYADLRATGTRKRFAQLATAGFVVAAQNFRGTHLSEDAWVGYRALGWGEKKDGFDTVEWLARQPWSTGKVGTFGGSQAGFAQNFLAVTQPPHLVCQYMIDTGLSLFHEGYRIGGITRPARFKQMEAVCRNPEDNRRLLRQWFAHPTYDDYWADEDCSRHFDKMNVPCFTVGSWYDFMCVGSVESFIGRQHHGGPNSRGKQQLLLGPWLHGGNKDSNKVGELIYPVSARFAMDAHMLRWFDHYLKGVDNGVEREATVRYYTMGATGEPGAAGNEWRTAADWSVPAQAASYYLRHGGKLDTKAPAEEESATTFAADPGHPNTIPGRAFPGARDARPFEKQAEVRTFTSEVLAEPVEWTGKVQAELYVGSTAKDTDFIVRLSDVYPDGRSILLMDYIHRARYRDGYDREVLLKPGEVSRVVFDVGWTSQIFNRGHRIRITVASTGAPFFEPNPNTGEPLTIEPPAKTVVAKNTVYHNRRYASRILAPLRPVASAKATELEQAPVFLSGRDGYHTYRIPSLLVTKKGTLLAFCEGRKKGGGDAGDIDLLLKRSFDGGKTWAKTQVVWDDGENTCGNPCPVVDQRTGTIWLLLTHNLGHDTEAMILDGTSKGTRTVWVMRSDDDGATWSKPVEITRDVKKRDWTWYATGPGVGIQLKTGRLVIPCDNHLAGSKVQQSHVIISDDAGKTWKLGGVVGPQCDESQVVELRDGSLLLNMRSYRRENRRLIAISKDGGDTFSKPVADPQLIEPVCQASILRYAGERGGILFSNPASTKREKMTVRLSRDEGKTWSNARVLHDGPSAYSCLAVLPNGTIACLYERGDRSAYETITFARCSLDGLADSPQPRTSGAERPRLIVLTDIGGDPDDQQSMIRLMLYSNEFDIDGLIASAAGVPGELKKDVVRPELIREIVRAYGKVRENLLRHAPGYPPEGHLLDGVKSGNPRRGTASIGEGNDTEGSNWIIRAVDRNDPRPVHVVIWGGPTELAQALWRVRHDRRPKEVKRFVSRLRVYAVNHQDNTGPWILENFPDLFYVLGRQSQGRDMREATYRGMYLGGNETLTSRKWIDTHVRKNHGPLGMLYPTQTWTAPNPHGTLKEGDTPSWFFFLPNGLGAPEHPEWGGWGGRFTTAGRGLYRDARDKVGAVTDARATVWRWRPAFQADFQARMDWCVQSFREANHPPLAGFRSDVSRKVVRLEATPGERLALDASESQDPDRHHLAFKWYVYPEAGTYRGEATLENAGASKATLCVPKDAAGKTLHVILEVTDDGSPALTAYRRVVILVRP